MSYIDTRNERGYEVLRRKDRNGLVIYYHTIIAERALGKPLPVGAVVHHVNQIRNDNRTRNLVICPDHSYHALLHSRIDSLKACGRLDWLACAFCGKHDAPDNMLVRPRSNGHRNLAYHRDCESKYRKEYRDKNPTKTREYCRNYYLRNKDKILERNRARYKRKKQEKTQRDIDSLENTIKLLGDIEG